MQQPRAANQGGRQPWATGIQSAARLQRRTLMLFIDNDTVKQTLSIADSIDSQDRAFRGLVDGGSIHRPRIDVYVPTGREEDYYRWGTMEGASRDLGVFAIRMKSDVVSWPEDASGNWTEEKYCVEPRHVLRSHHAVQHRQRGAASDDQRRLSPAHASRGGRGARRAVPRPRGLPRRGDARLRRHGAQLPGKRSATSGSSPRCGSTAPRRSTGRATPPR